MVEKRKKSILVLFFLSWSILLTSFIVNSLIPNEEWYRIWGQDGEDWGYAIYIDNNDNIYLTGKTPIDETGDIILMKYNSLGDLEFYKTWGDIGSELSSQLEINKFNNIYITGLTTSYGAGGQDVLLLKFNITGDLIWSQTWGGSQNEAGNDLVIDSNSNIYIAGTTESFGAGDYDILLLKYNQSGDQIWNRTWGGEFKVDSCLGLDIDSNNNIFLIGTVKDIGLHQPGDIVLIKYDSNGNQLWNITWDNNYDNSGFDIEIDSNDFIYMTGLSNERMFLLKYNTLGDLIWYKTWGQDYNVGSDLYIDINDNIFVTGWINNIISGFDIFYLKFDPKGELEKSIIWSEGHLNMGRGIALDSRENIYIVGITNNFGGESGKDNILLIKNPCVFSDLKTFLLIILITSIASLSGLTLFLLFLMLDKELVDKILKDLVSVVKLIKPLKFTPKKIQDLLLQIVKKYKTRTERNGNNNDKFRRRRNCGLSDV